MAVDNRAEIREFLASRRAKVTPEQVGLPAGGGKRRVPGLRREEVAVLAGVSTDWYSKLEKGHLGGVSTDVLDAVARALQLDEAERTHLFNLARAARATSPDRTPRRRGRSRVRPSVQRILDSMVTTPAFVRNGRLDLVAINALGRALFSPAFADPVRPANLARFNFLDPAARDFYPDWNNSANTTVALLRTEAGRDPHNKDLADLIGELATRSDAFRVRWAAHDVRLHRSGVKHFHHPAVGTVELSFDALDLPTDPGLTLTAYTAEPGSPSEDALRLLASWAATAGSEPLDHTPTSKD
ncbi:helix-turn-helix transcriptional regulator [Pseudonocardia sp. DSM 110487]|uniref:helix-turn-helix transcriptional regulator n=1 Tax=Pseudonocardia sp. DSM 110487 TaxID=2865833 RepID=UPI001C69AD38|nr:helix-turn-helix transcriptional regulator [Pseudonocardia sp. DSM 110487]QYN33950.1 helix-turn-helix transcriptional regulator [Pseudonocardia sp. DSM 110487]